MTQIMKKGNDWFKSLGIPPDPKNPRDAGSYGPKLYTLAGHVNKPVCVELPMGVTIRDLVEKHGGGVWKGRKAKAVNPGGLSMGFVDVNAKLKDSDLTEYDIPLDFNGPGRVQCWVSARRRLLLSTTRPAWWMCFTTFASSSATKAVGNALPVAKEPGGCSK